MEINENKEIIDRLKKTIKKFDTIENARNFLNGKGGGTPHRIERLNKQYKAVSTFFQTYGISENSNALDIGCSSGRYIKLFLANGFKSYGIDTSEVAIKYANSFFDQKAVFINSSATHLPFKERTFDVVLCIELMHLFDDKYMEETIKNASLLIRPGGIFICDFRNSLNPIMWYSYKIRDGKHFNLKTRSMFKMINILKKYGFTICHIESLYFPISLFAPYEILFSKYEPK
ncbi:Ubiquinone biosynthesis O-methyltransferase [uncultured archaeon]|nr:Ubiquinone biosynthesis O-methyltransferase [uncultured archaeon]